MELALFGFIIWYFIKGSTDKEAYKNGKEPPGVEKAKMREKRGEAGVGDWFRNRLSNAVKASMQKADDKQRQREAYLKSTERPRDEEFVRRRLEKERERAGNRQGWYDSLLDLFGEDVHGGPDGWRRPPPEPAVRPSTSDPSTRGSRPSEPGTSDPGANVDGWRPVSPAAERPAEPVVEGDVTAGRWTPPAHEPRDPETGLPLSRQLALRGVTPEQMPAAYAEALAQRAENGCRWHEAPGCTNPAAPGMAHCTFHMNLTRERAKAAVERIRPMSGAAEARSDQSESERTEPVRPNPRPTAATPADSPTGRDAVPERGGPGRTGRHAAPEPDGPGWTGRHRAPIPADELRALGAERPVVAPPAAPSPVFSDRVPANEGAVAGAAPVEPDDVPAASDRVRFTGRVTMISTSREHPPGPDGQEDGPPVATPQAPVESSTGTRGDGDRASAGAKPVDMSGTRLTGDQVNDLPPGRYRNVTLGGATINGPGGGMPAASDGVRITGDMTINGESRQHPPGPNGQEGSWELIEPPGVRATTHDGQTLDLTGQTIPSGNYQDFHIGSTYRWVPKPPGSSNGATTPNGPATPTGPEGPSGEAPSKGATASNGTTGSNGTTPSGTTGGDNMAMYQAAVNKLNDAANQVEVFGNQDMAPFADQMAGIGWGVQVTTPLGETVPIATAVTGAYRALAEQMYAEGSRGTDARDRNPDAPEIEHLH